MASACDVISVPAVMEGMMTVKTWSRELGSSSMLEFTMEVCRRIQEAWEDNQKVCDETEDFGKADVSHYNKTCELVFTENVVTSSQYETFFHVILLPIIFLIRPTPSEQAARDDDFQDSSPGCLDPREEEGSRSLRPLVSAPVAASRVRFARKGRDGWLLRAEVSS
ncbi:hypothetical protein C7M84_000652 [Penaeus vannamei]|uniref:Uncharacterized protein n=1 Tax=Penaeus vannamei TaxID=6689 RepID=A0A423TVZ8_PENVA|nr:hypothetical protein C7M84_000652 [Penaeus vannamei]